MSKIISVAALLLGFLFAPAIGRGAPFIRGDSNGDGGLDISDSVDILFYLFLGAPAAPGCEAAADVDGLGTVEITDAVYGLLYLFLDGDPPPAPFPRCDEDPEGLLPCESYDPAFCPPAPSGRLVSASECKSHQEGTDAAAGKECLEYSLSRTTLTLRHIDAAFTCGIHIEAEVNIGEGTIEIVESESGAPADCLCLYDVDFQVDNLEPGTYAIDVKGLHGGGLKFTVDLQVQPSGSYCEPRDRYPWDTGQPEGRLLAVSGCGGFGEGVFAAPPSEECMTYELVGTTLTLHHLNAAFNCCPQKIEATIKVAEGTIDIVESETGGMCMCLCLYDLDLEIQNLPAGVYAISVTGGAAGGLKFTVDLQAQPSGSYCELRDEYPWEPGQDQPEGKLLAVSDCGGFGAGGSAPPSEECMTYELVGTTLTLHHLNAAFNCCPQKIEATIKVAEGTIDIVESETGGMCPCLCLYDLDLEIQNLPAGVYAISVTGGTAGGLKFTVDLQAQPSGSYCEPRDGYPWEPGQDQPEGKLLAVSDCGGFGAGGSVSAAEECMKYELAGTTLTLHHLNTAFNCCPKEIGATIRVADGAIDIVESEAEAGCRCECLYDLDLEIRNLPAGVYAISVTGGTAGGLKFTVDLQAQPSGSYCEPRDVYPWVP